jgi:pimeloyl-ACP methyl ester carboxylesterase
MVRASAQARLRTLSSTMLRNISGAKRLNVAMGSLAIEQPILVGHSIGGALA